MDWIEPPRDEVQGGSPLQHVKWPTFSGCEEQWLWMEGFVGKTLNLSLPLFQHLPHFLSRGGGIYFFLLALATAFYISLSLSTAISFSHAWYSTAMWSAVQLGWRVHSASGELYPGVWQISPDTALREMRGGRLTCCILLQHKKPM